MAEVGGKGSSACVQPFSKRPLIFVQDVTPSFLRRGRGALSDMDTNEYIDYIDYIPGLGLVTVIPMSTARCRSDGGNRR